jgi:hypothetical protein
MITVLLRLLETVVLCVCTALVVRAVLTAKPLLLKARSCLFVIYGVAGVVTIWVSNGNLKNLIKAVYGQPTVDRINSIIGVLIDHFDLVALAAIALFLVQLRFRATRRRTRRTAPSSQPYRGDRMREGWLPPAR